MKIKVLGLATCFNRVSKTKACIESLITANPDIQFEFIIVDDNSNDGTSEILSRYDSVNVIKGTGNLFYSGGMRIAIDRAKTSEFNKFDYVMLFNDDVKFFDKSIEKLINSNINDSCIMVGAVCSSEGIMSYSGSIHTSRVKPSYRNVMSTKEKKAYCDTFCANCVLIPRKIFLNLDNVDPVYHHAMGDFDYGWAASRKGYKILSSDFFVGECNDNPVTGTWRDISLPITERIRKKESVKGLPRKEWFYYLHKNHGLFCAIIYSITPYIKILLRR